MSALRRARAALLPAVAALAALAATAPPASAQRVTGRIVHVEGGRTSGAVLPAEGAPGPWNPLAMAAPTSRDHPMRANATSVQPDLLLLLGLFADSPAPHFGGDAVHRSLFDVVEGDGAFTRFWEEASHGALRVTGQVATWVRSSVSLFEAAGSQDGHGLFGERMFEYMAEVVRLQDAHIDYRRFDNDGPDGVPDSGDDDGFVDNLVIEYLEPAGSCEGPGIWPHFAGLQEEVAPGQFLPGWPTEDIGHSGEPIRAYLYLSESATECDGVGVQGANVMAHEFGHRLGLPDFYRRVEGILPQHRVWGTGCYELMSAGSWGCGTGRKKISFGPVHLSAYSRARLEFNPVVHVRGPDPVYDREFILTPAIDGGDLLRIPLGSDEDLWVEYRPRRGFDTDLPAGGVLIYHADAAWTARPLDGPERGSYPYYLIEADGGFDMRKLERHGGNRGEASDAWARDGEVRHLTYLDDPGLAPHGTDGEATKSSVTFHSILVEPDGSAARIRLSTEPQPLLEVEGDPVLTGQGAELRVNILGGTPPYHVAGTGALASAIDVRQEGGQLVVSLTADPGLSVSYPLRVADDLGLVAETSLEIASADPLSVDELIEILLEPGKNPRSSAVSALLDAVGNENGVFDVGDLRAYLRSLPPAG